MRTAIFQARFDQLDAIRAFVNHAAADAGMDEAGICALEMSVDEASSNVIEHAYDGMETGDIEITCDDDDKDITVILRDHGQPFDITAVPIPDISTSLEDRQVGGLGIFLMRTLMDDVRYERLGNSGNILTLVRSIKSKE
jgi:anti-sigma regulatory factor (Ser/Thr protein kinase)